MLAFDVGAFKGERTRQMLDKGYQVVAFEPNAKYANLLRRFKGVTVVQSAISDENGAAKFLVCRKHPAVSTLNPCWQQGRFAKYHWDEEGMVDTMTLDTAIKLYGLPEFIKIDVEGMEDKVLDGLSVKIPCICFEWAREFFDITSRCIWRCIELGYKRFDLVLGKAQHCSGMTQHCSGMTAGQCLSEIEEHPMSAWGDIYAR